MIYLLICLMIAVLLVVLFLLISCKRLQTNVKRLEKKAEGLEEHVVMMEENRSLLSHIQKDYNKQKSDLIRLTDSKCDDNITSDTGSLILDSILSDTREQCLCNFIHFTVECEKISFPFSKMDIISLFENILENAMEACLLQAAERFISLRIFLKNDFIFIICENSKKTDNYPIANNFQTKKPDRKNHGKGVAIVRDIIEKYNGSITYSDRISSLCLEIIVPKND